MPGGRGHENEEERGHGGKVRKYPHVTAARPWWRGNGEIPKKQGRMGRSLPFCCRLTQERVLASVSPSCTTRMDPTGKEGMRMSGIAW